MDRGAGPQKPNESAAPGEPPVVQQPGSAPQQLLLPVAGGATLVAVLIWLLQRLRRHRQPTPSERLAEATRTLGAASVGFAGRAAERVSETAIPAAERTGDLALHGVRAGAGAAAREAGRVGATFADVPHRVAVKGVKVHKKWRKWTGRLVMLLAGSTGYVLGAAAGRERYDQIVAVANRVVQGQSHSSADTGVTGA